MKKDPNTARTFYAGALACFLVGAVARTFTTLDAAQASHINAIVSLGLALTVAGLLAATGKK